MRPKQPKCKPNPLSNLTPQCSHRELSQSTTVEKDTPLLVDPGFLTVTDPNPIDHESYTYVLLFTNMNYMSLSSLVLSEHLEDYLQSTARDGIQALIAALYTLPIHPSPDGPLAQLPPPTTALPRAKPLPKPKAPTKWERFAASKGIQKKRRERKVWDEEKQEWVDRWGRDGKNKDKEVQWIHEVKADAGGVLPLFRCGHATHTPPAMDVDPAQDARTARKARVAKNERQRLQNIARAQAAHEARQQRHVDIDRTLASTRISTASMGKFDKTLEGDKKMRGVKRKVRVSCVGDFFFGAEGDTSLIPPKLLQSRRNRVLLLSYQAWKARPNRLAKKKEATTYSTFGKRSGRSAKAKVALPWVEKQPKQPGPKVNEEVNGSSSSSRKNPCHIGVHTNVNVHTRNTYKKHMVRNPECAHRLQALLVSGQVIHVGLAILDPLLLDQLLPLIIVEPIHQLDRSLTDARNSTDIPCRLWLAQQQTRKIYRTTCNRHRTSPIRNPMLPRRDNDIRTNRLHADRQIQMIAVPHQQRLRPRRRIVCIVTLRRRPRREIERLFECLVTLSERLLRHVCQVANLSKRPRNVRLATRDEDACGDDRLEGLSAEKLFFVRPLVQLLGDVANGFG